MIRTICNYTLSGFNDIFFRTIVFITLSPDKDTIHIIIYIIIIITYLPIPTSLNSILLHPTSDTIKDGLIIVAVISRYSVSSHLYRHYDNKYNYIYYPYLYNTSFLSTLFDIKQGILH